MEAILHRWSTGLSTTRQVSPDFSVSKIGLDQSILIFVGMGFAVLVTGMALCMEKVWFILTKDWKEANTELESKINRIKKRRQRVRSLNECCDHN